MSHYMARRRKADALAITVAGACLLTLVAAVSYHDYMARSQWLLHQEQMR